MTAAFLASLFFTVVLLVITAYFLMGSLPLLILKHDTPFDGRFIRGFSNIYYKIAIYTASATALSYAFAGRPAFAAGAAGLALLAVILRGKIIPLMDSLRAEIQTDGTDAIPGFRRLHLTAIMVKLAQLALTVWSLLVLAQQMK